MKKEVEEEAKIPAWLVTFSDLMTLLLTFFVLLLSMSVIDNQRKIEALGSIKAAFGVIKGKNIPEQEETDTTLEHGVFTQEDAQDLVSERVNEMHLTNKDIEFIIDRDIAIVRIADDVLFSRGSYTLGTQGKAAVDRLLPLILDCIDSVKILGSTGNLYDEFKQVTTKDITLLWRLSLQRALAIYIYIQQRGLPMKNILLEGIGEFHQSFKEKESASVLAQSRRTDFIFGKHDIIKVERLRKEFMEKTPNTTTHINGFEFSLE